MEDINTTCLVGTGYGMQDWIQLMVQYIAPYSCVQGNWPFTQIALWRRELLERPQVVLPKRISLFYKILDRKIIKQMFTYTDSIIRFI
jgi:hypothetical protein